MKSVKYAIKKLKFDEKQNSGVFALTKVPNHDSERNPNFEEGGPQKHSENQRSLVSCQEISQKKQNQNPDFHRHGFLGLRFEKNHETQNPHSSPCSQVFGQTTHRGDPLPALKQYHPPRLEK